MEHNHFLLLILVIFTIDTLLFPSIAKNPGEDKLPSSPTLGNWWRSITVSDLADVDGKTLDVGPTSRSFGVLLAKVSFVAVFVVMYFRKSNENAPKYVNIITLAALLIMTVKYIAYSGWFDDKQCSNYYISSISSDKLEDIIYKVLYAVFGVLLAFTMKYHPIRNNDVFTIGFLMIVPFMFYIAHWLTMKSMYVGCEPNIWFKRTCSISPATFYNEYISGGADESDTKSKSWDYIRRGLTVIVAVLVSTLVFKDHLSSTQTQSPIPLIGFVMWLAFGIPLLLNWLTTVDLERKKASDDTNSILVEGTKKTRDAVGWRCIMNKYGGLSGYFILLIVQLYILRKQLTL